MKIESYNTWIGRPCKWFWRSSLPEKTLTHFDLDYLNQLIGAAQDSNNDPCLGVRYFLYAYKIL